MRLSAFAAFVVTACMTFPNAVIGQSRNMPEGDQPRLQATAPGELPLPSGTFGIGRAGDDWTDGSRSLNPPGMGHGSFSDYPLLAAGGHAAETKIAQHNLALTEEYVRAFLDRNLKGAKTPLFAGGNASHPEATVRVYGH